MAATSSSSHVKHHTNVDINQYYEVKDVLGTGAFSEVRRGISRATGEEVAIKIMTKTKDNRKMEIIEIEIEVLKRVDHPNVIKLYEIFDNRNDIALVLQLITGGELFERIVKQTRYSEADASRVVKQLLLGLAHLHERDIIHRDLKPENLLLSNHTNDADVVVTDFGLSAIKRPGQVINRAVGTPGYLAPEVLIALDTGKGYGEEVDMFGVGVITYILLCGFPPFYGNDEEEVYVKTETCDYSYPPEYWGGISERAKNLIDSLLTLDLSKRLTARQALQHPWIASEQSTAHLETALVALKRFNAKRKFRGAIKGLLAINKMRRLTKSGTMLALIEKQLKQEIANTSSTSLLPTVAGAGAGTSPFTRSVVVVTSGKVSEAPSNSAMIGILDRNNIPFALCRLSVEQNTDVLQSLFATTPLQSYPALFIGDEFVGGLGEVKSLDANGALVSTVTRKLGALPATNLDCEHVTIEILAGRKLARKDLFTSDPYLMFGIVDSNDSTIDQLPLNSRCFASQIKMRTLNPKWNSVPIEFTFPGSLGSKFLRVECWDYDQIGKDDFMGVVYVGIGGCAQNENAVWYPFQARRSRKDKVSGDVQLIVSYTDNQEFRNRAAAADGRQFLHARFATQIIQNQILGNTRTDRQQVPARSTKEQTGTGKLVIPTTSQLNEKFISGSALYGAVQLEDCVVREVLRRVSNTDGKSKWATSFTAPRAFAVRFNTAELRSDQTYLWHGVWLSPFDDEVHECLITEVQNRSAIYTDDEQFAINEAGIVDYICINDLTQSVRAHLVVKIEGDVVYCPRRFIRFSVDRIVGIPAMSLTDAVLVPTSVV